MTLNELDHNLGRTIDAYTEHVRDALSKADMNNHVSGEVFNLLDTMGAEVKQALDAYRISIIEYLKDKSL